MSTRCCRWRTAVIGQLDQVFGIGRTSRPAQLLYKAHVLRQASSWGAPAIRRINQVNVEVSEVQFDCCTETRRSPKPKRSASPLTIKRLEAWIGGMISVIFDARDIAYNHDS